jgi:hypothetical protein
MGEGHNHVQLAKEQSERAARSYYPRHDEYGEDGEPARRYREAYWDGYYNALFQFCRCQEPWPSEGVSVVPYHLEGKDGYVLLYSGRESAWIPKGDE